MFQKTVGSHGDLIRRGNEFLKMSSAAKKQGLFSGIRLRLTEFQLVNDAVGGSTSDSLWVSRVTGTCDVIQAVVAREVPS